MSRLSVLMTAYNEANFIDYAIRSCLPYVDDLVIVEGSYLETQKLGQPARSTDGTCEIISKYVYNPKVQIYKANEQSDKDQRNVGLALIKELNPDGWLLIIDGDEVYDPNAFLKIRSLMKKLDAEILKNPHSLSNYTCMFKSLTFVNDFEHYTIQHFPRLMKLTNECKFINDNHMHYDPVVVTDQSTIRKDDTMSYFHYSFLKGKERFEVKKKWWETRFERSFDYGWKIDDKNQISDSRHKVYEFSGKHPEIMKDHPMYKDIKNG